jgi:hypothetical protein
MRMEIELYLKLADGWTKVTVLLDSGAEENFISRMFAKQSGLLFTGEGLRIVKPFNNKEEIIYSIIHVDTKLEDTIH